MTVENIPLNARSLAFKWDRLRYHLSFDAEHLIVDCQSATYSKNTKTPLRELRSELRRRRWIPDSAPKLGREARYLVLLAAIAYFSDIHPHVPLLAPLSLAWGLYLGYGAVRRALPLEKTIIDSDTEAVATIPHFKKLEPARKAFEKSLLRMIRIAKEEDPD
jgi:hypothetical protein